MHTRVHIAVKGRKRLEPARRRHTYTHVYTRTQGIEKEEGGGEIGRKGQTKEIMHSIICVLAKTDRFCFIKLTDRTRDDDERKDDVEDGLC